MAGPCGQFVVDGVSSCGDRSPVGLLWCRSRSPRDVFHLVGVDGRRPGDEIVQGHRFVVEVWAVGQHHDFWMEISWIRAEVVEGPRALFHRVPIRLLGRYRSVPIWNEPAAVPGAFR